jgi:hypothetical protein
MKLYSLVRGFKFLMYAALALVLFSGLIMTLWNWLVPTLFGGPVMNIAQALLSRRDRQGDGRGERGHRCGLVFLRLHLRRTPGHRGQSRIGMWNGSQPVESRERVREFQILRRNTL